MEYYLAIDIGASSGRHMLGYLEGGKLKLEEVYRFPNGLVQRSGHLCWDVDALYGHILAGLNECARQGKTPHFMGIDTWAVDFVLLDGNGAVCGDIVSYRDARTADMPKRVYDIIPEAELYERTGIQKQTFNSILQLAAIQRDQPEVLAHAQHFLMIPDYFNYLLTGELACEYTNATTTQLVGHETKCWDWTLIERLGLPSRLFGEIKAPGSVLGGLRPELAAQLGFDVTVVLPATHDTGSAVLAVPSGADALYISSGTWSLMGVERVAADVSKASRLHNFTNEGGYDYHYRYLKNIMGLWMLQSVRRELGSFHSFPQLIAYAQADIDFPSRIDVNDARFLAPESMVAAVKDYCKESNQRVPQRLGEVLAVIYHSLALCYAATVQEIETLTAHTYSHIHIIGGGCQDSLLNELTANACKRPVLAGPVEATAIGNLLAQMLSSGVLPSLGEARDIVGASFEIT